MALEIKYVHGESLDKSYFVGEEKNEKGEVQRVSVRASYIVPPSLHKLAADNKLKTEPEDYIAQLQKLCKDLATFSRVTAEMGVKSEGLNITAKGEEAAYATESVPVPKKQDEPTVALAEEGYTVKPVAGDAAPDTKKFFNRLPGKVPGEGEWAIDVNSSKEEIHAAFTAVAEDAKQKGVQIDELEGKLTDKDKEHELEEVVGILQGAGVDAKEIEQAKKDLMGLPEKAIGVVEHLLGLVSKKAKGGKPEDGDKGAPGGPAFPPGMPPKKASNEDKSLSELNITSTTIDESVDLFGNMLADRWATNDVQTKELTPAGR